VDVGDATQSAWCVLPHKKLFTVWHQEGDPSPRNYPGSVRLSFPLQTRLASLSHRQRPGFGIMNPHTVYILPHYFYSNRTPRQRRLVCVSNAHAAHFTVSSSILTSKHGFKPVSNQIILSCPCIDDWARHVPNLRNI